MSGLLDTNSRLICPTERTINRIFKPVADVSQTSRYLNHKNGMEHGKITFPAIPPVFYDINHFVKVSLGRIAWVGPVVSIPL